MILVWFWYGFGLVLVWFWYVFGMCFCYVCGMCFDMGLIGLAIIRCMSLLLEESGVCPMVLTGDVEH